MLGSKMIYLHNQHLHQPKNYSIKEFTMITETVKIENSLKRL
jgi:hypothetical protein